jgi:hypothetical protein
MSDENRKIWLRVTGPWYWRRVRAQHWKGIALLLSPAMPIAVLACVSLYDLRYPAVYWVGVFFFVIGYWMLVLDHTKWD